MGACAVLRSLREQNRKAFRFGRNLSMKKKQTLRRCAAALTAAVLGAVSVPVIAGGLISDKEDIIAALDAGAASISTTKEELWFL